MSEQFRASLADLMARLDSGSRRYVRCVKSNRTKEAWRLDPAAVREQLSALGILAAATVRQQGYPYRCTHAAFVRRYGGLLPRPDRAQLGAADACARVCALLAPAAAARDGGEGEGALGAAGAAEWQCGRTRTFYRDALHRRLEAWLALRCAAAANTLARGARAAAARAAARAAAAVSCQAALRGALARVRLREAVVLAFATASAERCAFARWRRCLRRRDERERARAEPPHKKQCRGEPSPSRVATLAASGALPTGAAAAGGGGGGGGGASPTAEALSRLSFVTAAESPTDLGIEAARAAGAARRRDAAPRVARSVSDLSPPPAILVGSETSVAAAARLMTERRVEAVLVTSSDGSLAGIVTATDLARKAVAGDGAPPPEVLTVAEVMTPAPRAVDRACSAVDALSTLTQNRFRHLVVLAEASAPLALLDVTRCLFDAIELLECARAEDSAIIRALDPAARGSGDSLLGPALRSVLTPTLGGLVDKAQPPPLVPPDATARHAASLLSAAATAVLVADAGGEVLGLVTPRSLLRTLAGEVGLDGATARDCMLPPPPTPPANASVLTVLSVLQDERASHALVVGSGAEAVGGAAAGGAPLALLDVLQLVCASLSHVCASSDRAHLRSFWTAALSAQRQSEDARGLEVSGSGLAVGGVPLSPEAPARARHRLARREALFTESTRE